MAPGALDRGRRKPLTRTTWVRERDLARRGPLGFQYTAGSGPPEPLVYGIRPANTDVGRGSPDGDSLLVVTVDVDPLDQVSDPRHPRRQRRVVEDPVHVVDRLPNERRCDTEWPLRLVKLGDSRVGRFQGGDGRLRGDRAGGRLTPLDGTPGSAMSTQAKERPSGASRMGACSSPQTVCTGFAHRQGDVLAYLACPRGHWTKIWSTNPLERFNSELARRNDVVGQALSHPGHDDHAAGRDPGYHPE
jgi:hypothetical protein